MTLRAFHGGVLLRCCQEHPPNCASHRLLGLTPWNGGPRIHSGFVPAVWQVIFLAPQSCAPPAQGTPEAAPAVSDEELKRMRQAGGRGGSREDKIRAGKAGALEDKCRAGKIGGQAGAPEDKHCAG